MTFDLSITEEDWIEQAICAQVDPEIFFPEKGGSTRDPKRVCATCPVQHECLTYALDHDERFGIWGGVSERDRRKLKQAGRIAHIDETFQESPMPTPKELPEYIQEIAELLVETEGHRDPLVRATRKIVVQAAIALDQAQAASPTACRECGCTDTDACFPTCSWVEPDLCSACAPQTSGSGAPRIALNTPSDDGTSPPPEPDRTPTARLTRAPSAAVVLMREHGVEASEVRSWCHQHGIEVSARGSIALEVVEAYVKTREPQTEQEQAS